MGRLDGKVALITGGARGMGKSHVRHFVAEGARVVFGDVLDDQGRHVAAGLGEPSCRYLHHDVTSEGDWAAAVALAVDAFGRLDVLVNNAGVLLFASIADMPLADFRRVLEVNAVGCWLGMKAVIEPMKAAGGGSIVNISSIEGFTGAAGLSAYSASKFAVRGMTKAAAQELAAFGIRVNSVHPGGVLTRMVVESADARRRERGGVHEGHAAAPVRRAGRDIAAGGVPGLRRVVLLDRERVHRRRRPPGRSGLLIAGGGMDDALTLSGRVAIVTGAGNGLGRAESLALARAGARLVLNDLPGEAVQAVAAEIGAAGGQAVVAAGDVAEWSTGEPLLAAALGEYGRLDILVNNAGVLRDRMIFTMSEQEWDLVMRVHLRGHFVTTRLATAYWREQRNASGGPVYARIVNTSSEAFLLGSVGQPNYAAAKAGIAALTVTTARSCSRYGVRANAICPRARTAMTAELMGPAPSDLQDAVDPLAPEHVAPLVVYLASPAAETINGEVFVVHGGVAAVMDPPRIRSVFHAGTADGMWTLDSVRSALGPVFGGRALGDRAPSVGFLCEDTLELATETIGFPPQG